MACPGTNHVDKGQGTKNEERSLVQQREALPNDLSFKLVAAWGIGTSPQANLINTQAHAFVQG